MKAVWWIKRDFRVTDNTCLKNALDKCGVVVPFFCWERCITNAGDFSDFHFQAQFQALNGLTKSITKRGGYVRIVFGEIIAQFEELALGLLGWSTRAFFQHVTQGIRPYALCQATSSKMVLCGMFTKVALCDKMVVRTCKKMRVRRGMSFP